MTVPSILLWIRRVAITSGAAACLAAGLFLMFSAQATRAKKEYDDFRARVGVPAMEKWKATAEKPSVGSRIELLPVPDFSFAQEESRLSQSWALLNYRRDLASEFATDAAFLAALLFVYQSVIQRKSRTSRQSQRSPSVLNRL